MGHEVGVEAVASHAVELAGKVLALEGGVLLAVLQVLKAVILTVVVFG